MSDLKQEKQLVDQLKPKRRKSKDLGEKQKKVKRKHKKSKTDNALESISEKSEADGGGSASGESEEEEEEEDDVYDEETGNLKKQDQRFSKLVKTISHIRPLIKKDIVDSDGLIHQPAPVVNGMGKFGLGKMGVHRAVVKFVAPPKRHPLAICFHFPNASLSHKQVLDAAKRKLQFVNGGAVESMQFVDRNVRHGTQGMDIRWVLTLNCAAARDELLRTGIHIFNRRIGTRRFDDVQQDEYREYRSYIGVQKRLFSRISDINLATKLPSALAMSIGTHLPTRETTPLEGQIKHKIARTLDGLSFDQMKRKLADIEKQHSRFFNQIETLRNGSHPNISILEVDKDLPPPLPVAATEASEPDTQMSLLPPAKTPPAAAPPGTSHLHQQQHDGGEHDTRGTNHAAAADGSEKSRGTTGLPILRADGMDEAARLLQTLQAQQHKSTHPQ